eukprot:TRINITY_DN8866_c0_g1_i1.p1 TRINITY_DN8866_c0_g1~~TRINITY_DN8866_c0_g1_i1.p1  ORF type:complete len:994 (+),score=187.58 TRINITY_DN8866_c0_g1_i1:107-3088(+)
MLERSAAAASAAQLSHLPTACASQQARGFGWWSHHVDALRPDRLLGDGLACIRTSSKPPVVHLRGRVQRRSAAPEAGSESAAASIDGTTAAPAPKSSGSTAPANNDLTNSTSQPTTIDIDVGAALSTAVRFVLGTALSWPVLLALIVRPQNRAVIGGAVVLGIILSAQATRKARREEARRRDLRAQGLSDDSEQSKGPMSVLVEGLSEELAEKKRLQETKKNLSKFVVLKEGDPRYVALDSLRGDPQVKQALQEYASYFKKDGQYQNVGGRLPRGVLLTGEPGTGKTYGARAIASSAGVPFLEVSGSEFRASPYSGVGTDLTMELFRAASANKPCIVFIDEIDSIGRARRAGDLRLLDSGERGSSVTQDQDTNLNALLSLMERMPEGVLLIGATNRPEVLDAALLRSGRFDRRLEFKLPDGASREDILKGLLKPFQDEGSTFDIQRLAAETAAFSPADLQGLVTEAGITAARQQHSLTDEDMQAAVASVTSRKSKARPEGSFQVTDRVDARFDDLQGCPEAKAEMQELLAYLRDPQRFTRVGARMPHGILLTGPPGVGKTLAARVLAGEARVPFLMAAGSEFNARSYVGEGTQLVTALFTLARKVAPCIVFIDEIDAVGRSRTSSSVGSQQDRENTLMQLLIELDGFAAEDETRPVLLVGATNRPELLDDALRRPGRLDRSIALELPDTLGREAILSVYAKNRPMAGEVSMPAIARRTTGLSGADLKNVMNEASWAAARRGAEEIGLQDVESALDQVLVGRLKRGSGAAQGERTRRVTAVHESGHALLGLALQKQLQKMVVRVSARPRMGGIGGVTVFEPADENSEGALPPGMRDAASMAAELIVAMGGRAAERATFGRSCVTTGAQADLRSATAVAYAMVAELGFSKAIGPVSIDVLGGGTDKLLPSASDETRRQVDEEVRRLLEAAQQAAGQVLESGVGQQALLALTTALLDAEAAGADLTSEDLLRAVGGEEARLKLLREAEVALELVCA